MNAWSQVKCIKPGHPREGSAGVVVSAAPTAIVTEEVDQATNEVRKVHSGDTVDVKFDADGAVETLRTDELQTLV